MRRIVPLLAFAVLPIVTLFLGLGVGLSYQSQHEREANERLKQLYTGESGSGQTVIADPEKEVDIGILWDVWQHLQESYIDPKELDVHKMVIGAVHGLVDGVGDPYTVFMTPQENRDFDDALNGRLEGIGAELTLRDGAIVVVAPIKGSPAQRSGLLPQDIITKVNGNDVSGLRLDEVVRMIRGPKGTSVALTIYRADEADPITLTIPREEIHVPNVDYRVIETGSGSVGYIELNTFGSDAVSEMREAVKSFDPDQISGVILDLRFNGGGLLDAAVDIVSMFLSKGTVVEVQRRDTPLETHFVTGQPILPSEPLVVLINEGSASASEIVAGALQDHKRAAIVGTQSFGKGTVQEILDLPGGASLRVTTARWLTPNGLNLGKKGVTPDVVVKRTTKDYQDGVDPQLEKAEAILFTESEKTR